MTTLKTPGMSTLKYLVTRHALPNSKSQQLWDAVHSMGRRVFSRLSVNLIQTRMTGTIILEATPGSLNLASEKVKALVESWSLFDDLLHDASDSDDGSCHPNGLVGHLRFDRRLIHVWPTNVNAETSVAPDAHRKTRYRDGNIGMIAFLSRSTNDLQKLVLSSHILSDCLATSSVLRLGQSWSRSIQCRGITCD